MSWREQANNVNAPCMMTTLLATSCRHQRKHRHRHRSQRGRPLAKRTACARHLAAGCPTESASQHCPSNVGATTGPRLAARTYACSRRGAWGTACPAFSPIRRTIPKRDSTAAGNHVRNVESQANVVGQAWEEGHICHGQLGSHQKLVGAQVGLPQLHNSRNAHSWVPSRRESAAAPATVPPTLCASLLAWRPGIPN